MSQPSKDAAAPAGVLQLRAVDAGAVVPPARPASSSIQPPPVTGPVAGPVAGPSVQPSTTIPARPASTPANIPANSPANSPGPARSGFAVRDAVAPAQTRARHWVLMLSFILLVLAPIGGVAWYLWTRAADQYASTVGFSVQREQGGSAFDLLGGITQLSGSSSSDTDILYEFLQSQKLVADIDAQLDLRTLWSRPENDPWFRFDPTGAIEDLVIYWKRMVQVNYDGGSGLIELRVLAFSPDEARTVAQAIYDEATQMINDLSAEAREDAIRYARDELEVAVERLKTAREAVTEFRNLHQIIDPSIDLQSQVGLMSTLQNQLAEALIEVDLLPATTSASDPRRTQALRRVEVIEARLADERANVGIGIGAGSPAGEAFAQLIGDYERLNVDREFAQQSYVAALAAYDGAQAEARRKSRYLAAHILPTTAETARFPERGTLLALAGLFLFLSWAILSLIAYSLKDRR